MELIEPYAITLPGELDSISDGIRMLRKIEYCARISHRSEEKQTEESWKRFISAVVLQHGDWSVTEHCLVSVEFLVNRGITHEIVRHRHGSYTQESTRFVRSSKGVKLLSSGIALGQSVDLMQEIEDRYLLLLGNGVAPQDARAILPNALAAKIIVTFNLRAWRHFFLMRTTKESHPEMREVTIPLLSHFQKCIPLLYDDIVPQESQLSNLRLPE